MTLELYFELALTACSLMLIGKLFKGSLDFKHIVVFVIAGLIWPFFVVGLFVCAGYNIEDD